MLTFLNWLFNFDIQRCLSYSERETVVHAKVDNSKLCCYFTEFGCFFLHNLHLDTQVGWFFDDFDRKAKDLSTVNLRILLQQFALSLRWAIIWQRENCMNLTKNNLITQEKKLRAILPNLQFDVEKCNWSTVDHHCSHPLAGQLQLKHQLSREKLHRNSFCQSQMITNVFQPKNSIWWEKNQTQKHGWSMRLPSCNCFNWTSQ